MRNGLQIFVLLFSKGQRFSVQVFCFFFFIFHKPNPYVSVTLIFHRNYLKLRILDGLSCRIKEFSETSVSQDVNSVLVMQVTVSFNLLLPESMDLVIEWVVNRRALEVHTAVTSGQYSSEGSKMFIQEPGYFVWQLKQNEVVIQEQF